MTAKNLKLIRDEFHSRTLAVEGCEAIEGIKIQYTGDSNAGKGCTLDNEIIPKIIAAVNAFHGINLEAVQPPPTTSNTHYNVADTLRKASPKIYSRIDKLIREWKDSLEFEIKPERERNSQYVGYLFQEFQKWCQDKGIFDTTPSQVAYTWFDTVLFVVMEMP